MNPPYHNHRSSLAKQATREGTFKVVQRSAFWHQSKLTADWMELVGDDGCRSFEMLQGALSTEGRFIGVCNRPEALETCRQMYPKETADGSALWVHGDILHLLADRETYRNVGILVYDGYDGAQKGGRHVEHALHTTLGFAQHQYEHRLGQFILVVNFVVQRANAKDKALHKERIANALGRPLRDSEIHFYRNEMKNSNMALSRLVWGGIRPHTGVKNDAETTQGHPGSEAKCSRP